jgi:hypothetical protein
MTHPAPTGDPVALEPCPFCGSAPLIHDIEPHTHHMSVGDWKMPDHPGSTVIECGCGCGLIDDKREAVIERWNRRAPRVALTEEQAMRVLINASDSLNITRVHELGGKTRTICDEAGLLELARAVERAHGITPPAGIGTGSTT